jgi:outer membrane biogenesis lipoprotein LolB
MAALLVAACSHWTAKVPETSPMAAASIDGLLHLNQGLTDLKGLGQMKLIHSGQTQSARMAWAETLSENKLRMDIMGAPGVTMATIACDGKWVYLRLNQVNRFYKKKNGQRLFERMVGIPITIQDIVQLLAGKIPLSPYRSAILMEKKSDHDFRVLELIDKWGRTRQRIFLASDQIHPMAFEVLKSNGAVLYRVEFLEMMNLQNYRLPKYLVLSNAEGEHLELVVEKYWPNQPLPSSKFILEPQN